MRSRFQALASVVAAVSLVFGVLASAGAQGQPDAVVTPPLLLFTVDVVVEGPVPDGTVFEVEVVCTPPDVLDAPSTIGVPVEATFTYDATGAPLGENSVEVGLGYTCHAEETVTGGAVSVTYACEAVTNLSGSGPSEITLELATCTDDQTVQYALPTSPPSEGDPEIPAAQGTVTVTNLFEEEEEPPPPSDVEPDVVEQPDVVADVVAATPPFTG